MKSSEFQAASLSPDAIHETCPRARCERLARLKPRACLVLLGWCLGLLLAPLAVSGQSYSLDWYKISGGGGTSTGGVYSVSGTVGQPDAGTMSGGNYSLTGGFWAAYAVQTPGAPWLTITLNPQLSTITVSWPVSDPGWQLQYATNLVNTGSTWSPCAYVTNGANCVYLESPPAGNRFYRLTQ